MKIDQNSHSAEDRARWKVVRLDNYTDIEGEVLAADPATGECTVNLNGETKTLSFACGIAVVGRGRH